MFLGAFNRPRNTGGIEYYHTHGINSSQKYMCNMTKFFLSFIKDYGAREQYLFTRIPCAYFTRPKGFQANCTLYPEVALGPGYG